MKRPKNRFTTEQAIFDAIEAVKNKIETRSKQATRLDFEADEVFKYINSKKLDPQECRSLIHQANEKRAKADKLRLRRKASETKIEKLGQKLSEFRTQAMAFLPDNSVQA